MDKDDTPTILIGVTIVLSVVAALLISAVVIANNTPIDVSGWPGN